MMNGYNFTERVRACLAMAREEAARLHHAYVDTEHALLGILRTDGVATTALQNLGVDLDAVRNDVMQRVQPGREDRAHGPDLPYTSRAKKSLELAMSQARDLGHNYVGTEHLLLGLLEERKGIAAQALAAAGITGDKARTEIRRILCMDDPGSDTGTIERTIPVGRTMSKTRIDFGRAFTEPLLAIITDASLRAQARGAETVAVADLLEAIILSSPVVSAAFMSRDIEIDALIADVRANE